MVEGTIAVVRGRRIEMVDGSTLRAAAQGAVRIILDLGAGDGRWAYRLARTHPDWLTVAVDANGSAMREASFRAGRKPSRGGAANAWFVRAALPELPAALRGLAEEIHMHLPWGSLLRGVLRPEPEMLRAIARVAKSGAAVFISVNCSAFADSTMVRLSLSRPGHETSSAGLTAAYAEAGIALRRWEVEEADVATSWGRRLGGRRHPAQVLTIEGIVAGG